MYKALMHGCDEVALKVVKTRGLTPAEDVLRQKEVGLAYLHARACMDLVGTLPPAMMPTWPPCRRAGKLKLPAVVSCSCQWALSSELVFARWFGIAAMYCT